MITTISRYRRPAAAGRYGACHARGTNAKLPPQRLIYVTVENVAVSVKSCERLGGQIVVTPRLRAGGRFALIRDPAGAVCGLYEPAK